MAQRAGEEGRKKKKTGEREGRETNKERREGGKQGKEGKKEGIVITGWYLRTISDPDSSWLLRC
jgi:hypothetical protein